MAAIRYAATMERLGADLELLSIIGSWRDTLDDAEVISPLEKAMANHELTAANTDKLDRLLEITGMFENLEPAMPIGVVRWMLLVSRHEGEGIQDLAQRAGRFKGMAMREINEWWTGGEHYGRPRQGLIEWEMPDHRLRLTPKGVEFRDRLLALL
jgi:hypothetical protein